MLHRTRKGHLNWLAELSRLPLYTAAALIPPQLRFENKQPESFALPFLHLSASMPSSLRPFLFLLITSPLIYDRTQENSFQVLIRISADALLRLATPFSSPPLLPLKTPPPPPSSLYLCSGLCSAALRPYQNRNTPWSLSPRSLWNTQRETPSKRYSLPLSLSIPFSSCHCDVSLSTHVYNPCDFSLSSQWGRECKPCIISTEEMLWVRAADNA